MASAVRRMPQITQGWRPVSAVYQPAMVAMNPEGVMITRARRNHRVLKSRFYTRSHSDTATMKNMRIATVNIAWNP